AVEAVVHGVAVPAIGVDLAEGRRIRADVVIGRIVVVVGQPDCAVVVPLIASNDVPAAGQTNRLSDEIHHALFALRKGRGSDSATVAVRAGFAGDRSGGDERVILVRLRN